MHLGNTKFFLTVQLSGELVSNEYSLAYIPNFTYQKESDPKVCLI